ncbi:hypothetical protein MTR67_030773 [Solanum verrucosum]|uniref:Uncharacterized protein n=1 Tax=Solanum verrucosum TaxID=315347 RepID=A0AAF0U189_SOLVR|nr:hypothetical protein MTR67_030773 [Solanum verrucosum]
MDEVKLKHREYCWKFGMSVFQEDEDKSNKVATLETGENNGNAVISNTCGVHGCKSKAMSLMRFPDTFYPCAKIALAPSKKKMCVCVRVWFWKALLCEVKWSRSKAGHLGYPKPSNNFSTVKLQLSFNACDVQEFKGFYCYPAKSEAEYSVVARRDKCCG